MIVIGTEDYVFYQGTRFRVEFYFTEKGDLPAKEYFDSLEKLVQAKLLALVKYLAEEGRIYDEAKFKIVDKADKIYEFKPVSERFFNFFWEGKKIIITNAYHKKGQKVDLRELARAVRLKKDYALRVQKGTYYDKP